MRNAKAREKQKRNRIYIYIYLQTHTYTYIRIKFNSSSDNVAFLYFHFHTTANSRSARRKWGRVSRAFSFCALLSQWAFLSALPSAPHTPWQCVLFSAKWREYPPRPNPEKWSEVKCAIFCHFLQVFRVAFPGKSILLNRLLHFPQNTHKTQQCLRPNSKRAHRLAQVKHTIHSRYHIWRMQVLILWAAAVQQCHLAGNWHTWRFHGAAYSNCVSCQVWRVLCKNFDWRQR